MKRRNLPARPEAGETLVEVLISLALMGLVIVALIGGIATMVIGSKTHRDRTNGNTSLVAAMEYLRSPATAPPACSYASPEPGVIAVLNIEAQINQPGGGVDFSSSAACPWTASPATPLLLQRITLQHTSTGQTLSFVKGKF
jgi:hypothetical protein